MVKKNVEYLKCLDKLVTCDNRRQQKNRGFCVSNKYTLRRHFLRDWDTHGVYVVGERERERGGEREI